MPDLILASASPRRLELLDQIGVHPACVRPADIDETPKPAEKPQHLAGRLARGKAEKIRLEYEGRKSFILAADTVVACGTRLLDKPKDEEQAQFYLRLLSGRRHKVYGGIALLAPSGQMTSRVIVTAVQFKRLSSEEISQYIRSGEWAGKAGGYAVQGRASSLIKSFRGSYSNIVGLSLYDVRQMLQGNGFRIPLDG